MAAVNDALLSQLHPSIISTINAVDADYVSSVGVSTLFCADTFECGIDNKTQYVSTKNEFISKFGEPNINKFGQGAYNVIRWLEAGGDAQILRVLPDDAKYAHAILNIKVKKDGEKKILTSTSDLVNVSNIKIKPVIGYTLVNNTNDDLLKTELSLDRTNFENIDEYNDYFIMLVKPNGRGEYYNKFGFRITPNSSFDSLVDSRVYNFETVCFDTSGSYSVIEGPFFVSFDPDSLSESNESMFIEDVVNKYSQYITVSFSTEQYLKIAKIINPNVNPYSLDVITGKTRIVNGETETFYCEETGKNEDVHLYIQSYDYKGEPILNSDEEVSLNISVYNSDNELAILENDNEARQYNYNTINEKIKILKDNFNDSKNFKTNLKSLVKTIKDNGEEKACSLIDNSVETSINNDLFNYSHVSYYDRLKPICYETKTEGKDNYTSYFFMYYDIRHTNEAYILRIKQDGKKFKAELVAKLDSGEYSLTEINSFIETNRDTTLNNLISANGIKKNGYNNFTTNLPGNFQSDITDSIITLNNVKKIDDNLINNVQLNNTLIDSILSTNYNFFRNLTTKNYIDNDIKKLNELKDKINERIISIEDSDEKSRVQKVISGYVSSDSTNINSSISQNTINKGINSVLSKYETILKNNTTFLTENTILYYKSLLNKVINNNENILEKINKLASYGLIVDKNDIENDLLLIKNNIKNNNYKLKNKISLFNEVYMKINNLSLDISNVRQSIVSVDKLSDTKKILSELYKLFEVINGFDLNNKYSQDYCDMIYKNVFDSNGDYSIVGLLIESENLINDLYFTEDDNKYLIYNEIYNKLEKIIDLYDIINKIELYNDSYELIIGFTKTNNYPSFYSCRVYRQVVVKDTDASTEENEVTYIKFNKELLIDNDEVTSDSLYNLLFDEIQLNNNEVIVKDFIGVTRLKTKEDDNSITIENNNNVEAIGDVYNVMNVDSANSNGSYSSSSYINKEVSITLNKNDSSTLNQLGLYDNTTLVGCRAIKSFIDIKTTFNNENTYPSSTLLGKFMEYYSSIINEFNIIKSTGVSSGNNLSLKEIIKNNLDNLESIMLQEKSNYYSNNLQNFNIPIKFLRGSDGSISKEYKNNNITKKNLLIKAYSGLIDEDVVNKDILQFDHILDANYDNSIKLAIADLARNVRKDFFFWCDTGYTASPQDCLNWRKNNFNVYTQYMGIFSQDFVYYDTFTSKDCKFTSSYILANKVPSVIFNNGIQYPIAGPRRGLVDGFKSINWIPNESYKELLYRQKINYIEKDSRRTKIGSQLTALDKNNPLSNINNMLVLLNIKKNVENIVANYQFEFNDTVTHNAMTYDLNEFLARYVENRSCESITSTVSATEYEKKQKIVRVSVVIKFNNVIERIVVSFDVAV